MIGVATARAQSLENQRTGEDAAWDGKQLHAQPMHLCIACDTFLCDFPSDASCGLGTYGMFVHDVARLLVAVLGRES